MEDQEIKGGKNVHPDLAGLDFSITSTSSSENVLETEENINSLCSGLLDSGLSSKRTGSTSGESSCDLTEGTIIRGLKYEHDSSDDPTPDTLEFTSTGESSTSISPEKPLVCQNGTASRPFSLTLPRPLHYHERKRSKSDGQKHIIVDGNVKEEQKKRSSSLALDVPLKKDTNSDSDEDQPLSKSLPYGTIMKKGEMIEFIADDLQEKIRKSSPHTKTESSGLSSRASSLRSISSITSASSSTSFATTATSGMSRSPSSLFQQSPVDIPPIDPHVLMDIENQARRVADSVDLMMGNLKTNLHKMSAITVGCLDSYKKSVDVTCDSVDNSIKSMYALMAKTEELGNTMKPVYSLADQIKEIKRLLDRFEAQLADKT